MAKVTTKELIDEYFSTLDEVTAKKTRAHIDRPEVYAYEKEIGKDLIDMNAEELLDMISTFGKKGMSKDGTSISYNSYKQVLVLLRSLFDMYIMKYQVIINPANSKLLKGKNAYERLKEGKTVLTFERLQEIIKIVYEDYPQNYYMPKYIELIILLFYCGFATSFEILSVKEDMIDFETRVVTLPTKKIQLSERCLYLFKYFNEIKELEALKGYYYPVSWHDSYFKFCVRESQVGGFDNRTEQDVAAMIVRSMTRKIRQEHKIDLNYRKIYSLGFYDYCVKQVGEDKTKELITATRNPEKTAELQSLMDEYGFVTDNITTAKNILFAYI